MIVMMHPTILLPKANVMVIVRIQPDPAHGSPKSLFVQRRGTSAHHHPIDAFFPDIGFDQRLSGIRAHRHICARDNHIIQLSQCLSDFLTIDHITDIAATIADVYANSNLGIGYYLFRLFCHGSLHQSA